MSLYLGTQLLAGVATNTIYNAHDLFDNKWTDHLLNDQSWLRADTFSWQDGTVYSNAYNHLVADYNGGTSQTETVGSYTITYVLASDGHKITTDETNVANIYNESGVAWYYILDTTNQRFKLPRTKYGFVGFRDTVGKYVPESLPNIRGELSSTGQFAIGNKTNNGALLWKSGETTKFQNESSSTNTRINGIELNANDSSSAYQDSAPVQQRATQMYLYFYVGQFSQTATEQTAGLNSELFNGKLDLNLNNMNPSATAKETIVGWGMADYTRGTVYTTNTDGVLAYDAKVVISTSIQGNCNARFVALDENDNVLDDLRCYGTTSANGICTCASSVFQKGVKYQMRFTNGGTGVGKSFIMIYPLKGDV